MFTLKGQDVYFAGRMLASDGSSVYQNRLGSVGLGFYPYGEGAPTCYGGGTDCDGFTGYRWDHNTNPYYAHNRYYSSTINRFLTADPARSARLGKPQSWNKYAYVLNDPVNRRDPTGLDSEEGDDDDDDDRQIQEEQEPLYVATLHSGSGGGGRLVDWGRALEKLSDANDQLHKFNPASAPGHCQQDLDAIQQATGLVDAHP